MEEGSRIKAQITSLASYLRSNTEQMLKEQRILQLTGASVNGTELSQKMVDVFETTINNEREKYIDELISKLVHIRDEKTKIELEFAEMQSQRSQETEVLSQENETLKREIESLESKKKNVEWNQQRKEQTFQNQLKEKETYIIKMNNLIATTQEAHQTLSQQIKNIRSAIIKMKRNQIRLLGQAKTMCAAQINETIESVKSKNQAVHSQKIGKMATVLDSQNRDHDQLEEKCQYLLDILNGYSSKNDPEKRLNVTVDDISNRASEVREFIDDLIESKKKMTIDELRAQLKQYLPEIEIDPGQNLTDAVNRYLQMKIKEKEIECQKILKRNEDKETLLKQKLKEALERVHSLQDPSRGQKYFDECEEQIKELRSHQKKLDDTMSLFKRTSMVTLTSNKISTHSDD